MGAVRTDSQKTTMTEEGRPKRKTRRVSFDFTAETHARFEDLMDRAQASSKAEIVRRSVELFSVIQQEQADGAQVIIRRKDGTELLLSPA